MWLFFFYSLIGWSAYCGMGFSYDVWALLTTCHDCRFYLFNGKWGFVKAKNMWIIIFSALFSLMSIAHINKIYYQDGGGKDYMRFLYTPYPLLFNHNYTDYWVQKYSR